MTQSVEFCDFFYHVHSKQVICLHHAEIAVHIYKIIISNYYLCLNALHILNNLFSIEVTRAK